MLCWPLSCVTRKATVPKSSSVLRQLCTPWTCPGALIHTRRRDDVHSLTPFSANQRKDGPVRTSKRPIMLKYKSWLQEYIVTAALWPLSLLGFQKESQELYVFMFEDFVDNPAHPVTRAKVTLSKPIQVWNPAQSTLDHE